MKWRSRGWNVGPWPRNARSQQSLEEEQMGSLLDSLEEVYTLPLGLSSLALGENPLLLFNLQAWVDLL